MLPDALHADDVEACRRLLADGSKSFALASKVLPERVREPATVLYAFCREADDAVDSVQLVTERTVDALRYRVDRVYRGWPIDQAVDRALARVVEASRLPRVLVDALIDGLAWDAEGRRYETLDDLHGYAARVAGTVGAAMTIFMGPRDPLVLARACDLGVAMQLTNIARDVGEDAGRGRVYLPLSWLHEAGIDVDAFLSRPVASEPLAHVVRRLLASADDLYRRADEGITHLPRDCRIAIRAASLIYSEIGREVERARFDSVSRRAVVSKWRKLWLLLRATSSVLWAPARLKDPPLEPVRFLVSASAAAAARAPGTRSARGSAPREARSSSSASSTSTPPGARLARQRPRPPRPTTPDRSTSTSSSPAGGSGPCSRRSSRPAASRSRSSTARASPRHIGSGTRAGPSSRRWCASG